MTFRAKPVVNRPHRPSRDGQSRRNTYLNIGFGIAVVLAVVILVGVAVVSYYREHLAPAATRRTARRSRATTSRSAARSRSGGSSRRSPGSMPRWRPAD